MALPIVVLLGHAHVICPRVPGNTGLGACHSRGQARVPGIRLDAGAADGEKQLAVLQSRLKLFEEEGYGEDTIAPLRQEASQAKATVRQSRWREQPANTTSGFDPSLEANKSSILRVLVSNPHLEQNQTNKNCLFRTLT